jgi:hypothetical protein
MATAPRSIPIGTPRLPGRIVEGLRRVVADPKRYPNAYVRLSASGGVHGEAYDFEYRIDAAGRASGHLRDELKGVTLPDAARGAKKAAKADPARFVALVRSIDIEALMRSDAPGGGFVPDSVVGRLEISDGEQTATFLFPADDEQARRAKVADPLRQAADALFGAAAAHLGAEVRP